MAPWPEHKKRSRRSARGAGANPLVIEAIEPRLLLSATPLSGTHAQSVAQALHDNLAHFEAVLAALEHNGVFANELPMISGQSADGGASLGSIVKLSSLLDADVVTPLTTYVQQIAAGSQTPADTAALASGIASAINSTLGSAGTATVTDDSSGGNVDLAFSLNVTQSSTFALSIGSTANVALTFPGDLQGVATSRITNFDFTTTLTSLTPAPANFTLSAVSADVSLSVAATIPAGHEIDAGLLTLETTAASTLSYTGDLHIGVANAVSGADLSTDATAGTGGQTAFLTATTGTGALGITVSETADPVLSYAIPVTMAPADMVVPGLGAGFTGSIGLTGNVLDGSWSAQLAGSGLSISVLHDFAALSPSAIVSEFDSLDTYFSSLTGSSLTNVAIPFTDGTTLSQVLNFARNFQTDVVDKLEPVNDLLGFSQGQDITAADGSHIAQLTFTPTVDLSSVALPAAFDIDITANGHTAALVLSNQFTDAQGNQHTVASVNDLVTEMNTLLSAAPAGSTLAALAAVASVAAVSSNTETLGISDAVATVGGTITSGDMVELTIANTKGLASGPVTVSVTAATTDTTTTIAAGLAAAIDGNAALAAAGITAAANNGVLTVSTAANDGTTMLSVPDNAIQVSAAATGSDAAPASAELTAPAASFGSLASLAVDLGNALGLGSDISDVTGFLNALGFTYDPSLNAIEFNINYSTSISLGSNPTETLSASGTTVSVGGSVTPGDTLSVTVEDPEVANDSVTIAYAVQSNDTPGTITTGLIDAINANSAITGAGLVAAPGASADTFTIAHTVASDTAAITLTTGTSGGIAFGAGFSLGDLASLSGSGDLALTASIAASLTIGFSLDPLGAQANGVQVTVNGQPLGTGTNLFDTPVWTQGTASTPIAAVTADQIAGTTGKPDMELMLRDGTTGTIEVQHGEIIDTIGGGAPVVVTGSGTDDLSLNIQGAVGAGETVGVTLAYGNGNTETVSYTTVTGDTTSTLAAGLAAAIDADATLSAAGITAGSAANTLALYSKSGTTTLTDPTSTGAETFDHHVVTIGDLLTAFDDFASGTVDVTVTGVPNSGNLAVTLGGSTTAGDTIALVISAPTLTTPVLIQHTAGGADTLATLAQAIATTINANSVLEAAGVTATYASGDSFSLAGNASVATDPHSVTLASQSEGELTVTGSATAGDLVSVSLTGGTLGSATETIGYTVQHGDTLTDVADGLQAAINADTTLSAAGVTAAVETGPLSLLLSGGVTASYGVYSSAITAAGNGDLNLNGTPSAHDVTALLVTPSGGSAQTAAYTVKAGDTADDVIAKLADAINVVDPSVSAVVAAVVDGADSISVANSKYLVDTGYAITLGVDPLPGDVLKLAVNGQVLNVTVRSGYSSPEDVIAAIVDAINDAAMPGVSGSLSAQITGATLGTVAAPTETGSFSANPAFSVTADGTGVAGDVLSVTVTPSGHTAVVESTVLTGGETAAQGLIALAAAIDASSLSGDGVSAGASGVSLSVSGAASVAVTPDATETVTAVQTPATGSPIDTGDVLSLTFESTQLGAPVSLGYTVTSTDTLSTIASGIRAEINANSALNAAGIHASISSGNAAEIVLTGNPGVTTNPCSISLSVDADGTIEVSGTPSAGDVMAIGVTPTGGSTTIASYVAQSTDTRADVIAKVADAIDGIDPTVSATIEGSITGADTLTVWSATADNTADLTVTDTAIEVNQAHAGDQLSLNVNGRQVDYTVVAGHTAAQDVVAGLVDAINNAGIDGVSASLSVTVTNASLSVPSPAGETLTVTPGAGGVTAVYDTSSMDIHVFDGTTPGGTTPASLGFLNGTTATASKLSAAPSTAVPGATTWYQAVVAASPSTAVDYSQADSFLLTLGDLTPVEVAVAADSSRTTAAGFASAINQALAAVTLDPASIGLNPGLVVSLANGETTGHHGDTVTIDVHNSTLTGGVEAVTYTVASNDTAGDIATGLVHAINADAALEKAGITASVLSGDIVSAATSLGTSTLTGSASSTAETLAAQTIAYNQLASATGQAFTVQGTVTAGDVVSLSVDDNGTATTVSYTAVSGDTAASIASALATAIGKVADMSAVASGASVVFMSTSGNTVTVTDTSAATVTESVVASLTLETTMFNEVSASATNQTEAQAASFGIAITPLDTTLTALNGSQFISELGFGGIDSATLNSPVGELSSGPLYSTTLSDRFFFFNTAIVADVTMTLSNLTLQGAVGFIGFDATGNGSLELEAALRLESPDGNPYVTFHELQTAYSTSTLGSYFRFTVGAPTPGAPWAELDISSITLTGSSEAGNVIADLANALVSPSIDIVFDSALDSISDLLHARPAVTVSGFGNIDQLKHLSAADILAGLTTVLQVIDNDTGSQILSTTIPILGISIGSLLNYAQDFNTFLTNLESNPSGEVAQLNTAIQNALGSYGSDVNLAYTNGALMLSLTFTDGTTQTLPFSLDLATLAADAGITLPSEITDIAGASGNGDLSVTASATLGISVGIQLQAPAATLTTPLLNVNGGSGIATTGTSAPDIVVTTGGDRQFAVDLGAVQTTATAIANASSGTVTIGGTATAGETVSLTLDNSALDGSGSAGAGAVTITHTVSANDTPASIANALAEAIGGSDALTKGGITATVSGDVITVTGAITIVSKVGGNVQELLDAINAAASAAGAGADFASLGGSGSIIFTDSATSQAASQNAAALGFTPAVDVTGATSVSAHETGGLTTTVSSDSVSVTGTPQTGDSVTITVNGQDAAYTVTNGDSLSNIDQKLADAIDLLKLNGVSASVGGQVAAEQADASVTLTGAAGTGDAIALTVGYGASTKAVSYTAVAGDTLDSEASALAAAIDSAAALQSAGVTAVATGASVLVVGDNATLTGAASISGGTATETVTAGGVELASGGAPASFSAADTINLVIDGQTESLFVGANASRTTAAELATAIEQALAISGVDQGIVSTGTAGTQVPLCILVGAVADGSGVAFAAADAVLGATPALAVANPPAAPLGIAALGFSGSTTATDAGGTSSLTATLPATIDTTQAYEFQLVVNGVDATISLSADPSRTTDAAFVKALDVALGSTFIDQSAAHLGSSGKALLASLVSVADDSGVLTFSAPDAHLGSSHSLGIQDVSASSQATLRVADIDGSTGAESLGFAQGAQSVSAALSAPRVLTATALTDNSDDHRFFIDTTDTGLTLSLGASITNLNFQTNIGPLAVGIEGGSAVLGAETLVNGALPAAGNAAFAVSSSSPGTLHFGLNDGPALNEQGDTQATADRLYFGEIGKVSQLETVRIGGATTAGDTVSLNIVNAKVPGGETVSYAVMESDTAATIASALAAAINGDATLSADGITASDGTGGAFQVYGATSIAGTLTGTGNASATETVHVATGYGNLLQVTSNIAVQVSLPIYFLGVELSPVVSVEIGNLLGGPSGWALDAEPWTLSLPNLSTLISQLASSFNLFSYLNNPEAVINGLNSALGMLDTLFTQQVFGVQLPLIGPALADAGDFIGSMRATLIGDLNGLVSDYENAYDGEQPTTADLVTEAIDAMATALGFNPAGTVVTVDAPDKTIDFVLELSKTLFDGTINLTSNLGIPGLGISVQNGSVGLDLSTRIYLAFDYVQGVGFNMLDSTAGEHAVGLTFAVTVPVSFQVGLTLGILTMTGSNGSTVFTNADNTTATGTTLTGGIYVDLHPKSTDDLADLGSTSTVNAATDAGGTQTVQVTLPSDTDPAAAYAFDVVINGTAVTVTIAADSGRATEAELVSAINTALGAATIKTHVVNPNAAADATESLAALGVTATLNGQTLSLRVADSALGASGKLALTDVPIAFTRIGQNIRVEMAANFDLDLKLQATLMGGDMELPSVSTEMLFAYQFDRVLVGTDPNAVSGVVVPFTFQNVTLDLGSFLSGFLAPLLSDAEKIVGPIMPILNFVTSPLPGISTLLGKPISILNLAQLFGQADPKYASEIATVTRVVTTVDEVANLITTINALTRANGGTVEYDFGTFTFGRATVGPLANAAPPGGATAAGSGSFDPFGGATLTGFQLNSAAIGNMAPASTGNNPTAGSALGQLKTVETGGGISLPILQNPLSALELLMGQTTNPVTLFEWTLPTLTLSYGFQTEFPVASIGIISLNAIVGASVSLSVHFAIGYDTLGITEFLQTHNPVFIANGFFVDDTQGPQLIANVSVTVGVSVSIPIAEVGITGTIGGDLSLQLYDASGTGKVRLSAILSELETGDPLNLFVVAGDIYAEVSVFVWVGLKIPLIGKITLFSWDDTLVNATLVSFVLTPPQHPILATAASDGTVTLNMGELSSQRDTGDTSPSDQNFTLTNAGGGNVTIAFGGSTQTIAATSIVADTGDGNSDVVLRDLSVPISISGGSGNNIIDAGGSSDGVFIFGDGNNTIIGTNATDTITVGDGDNTIIDGNGNNIITAGNGNNYIASGSGADTIIAGNGDNMIVGGGGNNTISVGSGNNILIGGSATSVASTFTSGSGGNLATYTVYGPNTSGVVSNTSANGDGNNVITLGTGDNIVLGGGGTNLIRLNSAGDNFIVAALGSVTLANAGSGYLANWDANGHAAVVSSIASGTTGGNEVVDGTTAFGDNVILGGPGHNTLTGGAGTNIILGDDGSVDGPAGGTGGHFTITATATASSGNDIIQGGPSGDVLIGGYTGNTITGGAGSDLIGVGDVTVVRSAALGTSAALVTMTETSDGADGHNTLIGGSGDNVLMGGGGSNVLSGGSGNNILLGEYGTVDASSGTDVVVTGGIDTTGATNGNNTITSGDGNNVIIGGGGANSLTAGNGNDVFFGGNGRAALSLSNYDVISAQTTTESIGGDDTISITGNGNNVAMGGPGQNSITVTGTGNNVVLGDLGSMAYSGSTLTVSGHDTSGDSHTVGSAADIITIAPNSAGISSGSNVVMGGPGADTITVSANGNNIILGDSGTATLTVGAGGSLTPVSVTTNSGTDGGEESIGGNNTIDITGAGGNVVMGGAGDNSIDVAGTGNNVVLGALGSLTETVSQLVVSGHDAASNTGNIGYADTDVITIGTGASGNNVVMGGAGGDTITVGANGNNVVLGDSGTATLTIGNGGSLAPVYVTTFDGLASGEESIGGNNTIGIHGNGNNVVLGGAGDNTIGVTGSGDNIVLGALGNVSETIPQIIVKGHDAASDTGTVSYADTDVITIGAGASGNNVVMGGAGGDTITVDANGNNVVLGDSGTATLTVGNGGTLTPVYVTTFDGLTSGEESIGGNNSIGINGDGNNAVLGGAGDNSIDVTGTGNNVVLGALGNLTETISQQIVTGHDAASNTGTTGYADTDVITIGAGAAGNNVVMGGAGGDTITVDANGNNVVLGDSGTATLTVGAGGTLTPVYVTTFDGLASGEESIGGNNTVEINSNGNNVVLGGAGDNIIGVTGSGDNIVLGALGNVSETSSQIIVKGHDAASDTGLAGYADTDVITIAQGGSGSNVVMGGAGRDTITVDANGSNVVLGDSGTATLTVSGGGTLTPVYVTTFDGLASGEESIGGNNTIGINGNGNNVVLGGAGDNSIDVTGTGNNIVLGALGNVSETISQIIVRGHDTASDTPGTVGYADTDVITIGTGAFGSNVVVGGAGGDTITVDANGNDVVLGNSGTATLTVGAGGSLTPVCVTTLDGLPSGEESIGGNNTIGINGDGNNVVLGGAGDNIIGVTGSGDNIVLGALGNVSAKPGQIVVEGHDAASNTAGYADTDVITIAQGGSGSNVVMGGAGGDTITVDANGNNAVLGDSGTATLTVGSGGSLTPVYVTTFDGLASGEESIGGNNTITINGDGNNVVLGGAGDNTIGVTGTGNNIVMGAIGSIAISVATALVESHDAASDTGSAAYPDTDIITVGGSGNGSNIVIGGAGSDTISVTSNGNNYVLGDSGFATVSIGTGGAFLLQSISTQDTHPGGEESIGGNNTITVTGNGNNAVLGGAGTDTISVDGSGNNVVLGDLGSIILGTTLVVDGHDAASDTGNADYPSGNVITLGLAASGTDIVMGGAGANLITQNGAGNAYILGHNGQAIFTGWSTSPVLQLLTTVTTIDGGEEAIGSNTTIDVNGNGDNVVMGGAGQNTITLCGSGHNILLGHLGRLAPVTVGGIAGYDLLGHNTALGNTSAAWNDVITLTAGASGDNTIMGGAGNNLITVLGAGHYSDYGDNVVFGASGETNPVMAQTVDEPYGGNDRITIGAAAGGDNTIFGGAGNDVITIYGAGDNSVFGNMGLAVAVNGVTPDLMGRDTAIGGDDTITLAAGANGNNVVMGEAGSNIILASGSGLNVLLGHTGDVTHQQFADRLYPLLVQSTDFGIGGNSTITATQGNNVIAGGVGNNTLTGGTGDDYMIGHDGVVQFNANVPATRTPVTMYSTEFQDGGNDVINAGNGPYSFVIGGTGSSTIDGGAGDDLLAGGQALIDWNAGGSRAYFATVDTLPADSAFNTITGHGGNNDILGAQGGADTLTGGPGSNIIIGHGGQIWFRNNTEVTAQTLNVFNVLPDTIIGGGPGHNFLFGGGTANNLFHALPLGDIIYNTDGIVNITGSRTGEWTMPPFLGNPVTSMIGNWLPGETEGIVAGAGIIDTNSYYTETTVIDRLTGIAMMKGPAPQTLATPLPDSVPPPSAPADGILLGDTSDEVMALDDGGPAGAVLLTDDDGATIDAAALDAGPATAVAYLFDSPSGFWVIDDATNESVVLSLTGEEEQVEITFDDEDRLAA